LAKLKAKTLLSIPNTIGNASPPLAGAGGWTSYNYNFDNLFQELDKILTLIPPPSPLKRGTGVALEVGALELNAGVSVSLHDMQSSACLA
jgi:hypothetical protein